MTHNPTPAEVQVIYDHLRQIINGEDYAAQFPHVDTFLSVEILLAAVARDTLGWREVKEEDVCEADGGAARLQLNRENGVLIQRFFIKDPAP